MPATSNDTIAPTWAIELTSDEPVARFAARELHCTLQRIGAPPLPIVSRSAGSRIALRCGAAGDGFVRATDDAGLILHGDGPRGLLYAVYDLMESLGCRWVAPGALGEHLPRYEHVVLPQAVVAQQPALPGRCLVIGHDFFLDTAEEWIIWAARNRLNTIFIHTIDQRLALGACHLRRWHARRSALLPLLHERGMRLELGGHGMRNLIPRGFFLRHPAIFRHDGIRRTLDHNFCPSHPAARQLLRSRGAAFFYAHPEAQVFHLWPDDILGGGWCRCMRCRSLSASDQALLATNDLAEVLESINAQARLAYLAYHDTTAPPRRVAPRPNVVLVYAPRSRSYAYGIADSASPVNSPLFQHLLSNVSVFNQPQPPKTCNLAPGAANGSSITTSAHRVFEYYLDGILFKSAPPPLPAVIRADLRAYRDTGVHTVQALMTGDRPWLVAPVNAYLFARLAWDPDQNLDALLLSYASARAPRSPAALMTATRALASAWRPVLDILPDEQISSTGGFARRDVVIHPPVDVLDYMAAPQTIRESRLEQLASVAELLDRGRVAWGEVLKHAHDDIVHLAPERAEWELGARLLRFIIVRQQLYVLDSRMASRASLLTMLDETQAALDALLQWGQTYLVSAHARRNYHLLRMITQLQIDALYDQRIALPWERVWLRLRRYGKLFWLVWHLLRR